MLKKLLLVLMAAMMVFSFAACGDKSNDPGELVKLTWLVPGEEQPDMAAVLEKVNAITESKIGVTLDLQMIPQSAYEQRVKMMMASGSGFDICFTSSWLNKYIDNARLGGYYDITDLVDKELKNTMKQKIWDASMVDGRLYAVPNNQVMFTQLAVGLRKDLVEKYNFDINTINTIEDIEPFLELVKQNETGIYPYNNREFTAPWTTDYMQSAGGVSLNYHFDTGEIVRFEEDPIARAAITKIREWYDKGYIRKDYMSAGQDTNVTDINQGKYAVMVEIWKPGIEYFSDKNAVQRVYKPITKAYFASPQATMTAISATCQYPEKAMELIKLVNLDKELFNLLCYGIEGQHYNLNEEGKLVPIDESGYASQGDWKFGNQFNAILSAGMPDDVWEETNRLNEEAIVRPLDGYTFNPANVKFEMSQLSAGTGEFGYGPWVVAENEEEFLAKRNAHIDAAGFDKVRAEVERQVNEFLKNK